MRQSTTTTRQTKACKIERTLYLDRTDALRATVTETKVLQTKTTSSSRMYRIHRISCQFGVAAASVVNVATGDEYNVLLDGRHSTCDCPGHTYNPNGRPCTHLEIVAEAQRRKLL